MEQNNSNEMNKRKRVFTTEAINFSKKAQDFIRRYMEELKPTKPLHFDKPFLSIVDGELKQVDGITFTTNGRIKPIIYGWDITETPSIMVLDITTLVKIADKLDFNEWKYKDE